MYILIKFRPISNLMRGKLCSTDEMQNCKGYLLATKTHPNLWSSWSKCSLRWFKNVSL